jgi:hypothetical protein
MSIPFQIQVKPCVRIYLSYFLSDPYKLNRNDFFGNWLFMALRDQKDDTKYNLRIQKYSEKITVLVGRNYVFNNRLSGISAQTTADLNGFVYGIIKHQFLNHMLTMEGTKPYNVLIEEFRTRYGFTEDSLKYECLNKYWFRFRKEQLRKTGVDLKSFDFRGLKGIFEHILITDT